MKLKVLGSSGAEFPGFNPPGFLIDGKLLFDAGTIGAGLSENQQWNIRYAVLTHAHLDHIRGIPFLADNIIIKNKKHFVTVIGIENTLKTLKENLLNNKIWPDFTAIPSRKNPVLKLLRIKLNKTTKVDSYKLTAYKVNHSIPAVGYVLEDKNKKRLLYTGDTGPTNELWEHECKTKINAAIIEVSFPNKMTEFAVRIGHLTPAVLVKEIEKMKIIPDRILITHPKPQHIKTITKEIKLLKMSNIRILKDGEEINI
ncbi:MAG: 3',5'-cyclic-nucleotide phosphodiesterase [Nitrospiraceae bacterium]|nr:3',5'-cyclic-nucleotide phosphodiesterase [Nitrospiraceae bacterium]